MSNNITVPQKDESTKEFKPALSFVQGIALIFGTNITKATLQVSGLAEHYLGQWGRWLVFVAIIVNGIGALIAYAAGSGDLINNIFGLPPLLGTLIFCGFGSWVMYRGLHTTGATEGAITAGMAIIIAVLCGWTILGPGIKVDNLLVLHPFFIVPILNLAVFSFLAQ